MPSRRPSPAALILAWALLGLPLACTRKAPPLTTTTASAAAAPPPSSPPSASTPNTEASAPTSAPRGTSSQRFPEYAVSIPGVLTIRAPDRDSQSHGVGDEPWVASFLVTNETAQPLSVRVSDLALLSDDAGLASADRAQGVRVTAARAAGAEASIQGGVIAFTAPPQKQIELRLVGDFDQHLRVFYHVVYRHEAAFEVGAARVTGRGYAMYFRYPHTRTP